MRYDTLYPEDDFKGILHALQKKSPADIATDLRKTYEDLLFLVGCALFKIARQYVPNQAFDFYFWPGYESIYLKRGAHTRVTLLLDPRDKRMQCGVGFNLLGSQTEPVIYHDNRSVLWFDRVLSPQGDYDDFTPGSTHKWLVQDGLSLSDGARLQILDVSTSAQPLFSEQKGRMLSARLDSSKSTEYGEQMSIILNGPDVVGTRRRWPHSEQDYNEEHNHLREKLYDIWLGATLGPPNEPLPAEWLATVAHECVRNGANKISTAIVSPAQLPPDAQEHHYRHWYSVAIDPTFGSSQELGTAMLLTSCDLPAECLMECQRAVRVMYLEWRNLEEHLLKVPACDPFVCELSASEWNLLREAMWKTCETLGCDNRNVGHPFWAHHLPGGGESPWRNPPVGKLVIPWTGHLITTATETLTMVPQQPRDIQRLVQDWPPHEWAAVGDPGFEECFCWMPPIRALAQFDKEAGDLTKLFERLRIAVEKLKYIECDPLFDDIEHNYLWFNAPALAHCLFRFARGLSSDLSNKREDYVLDKQYCTGATVRWDFSERQDVDSISFIVRVQQLLHYPKRLPKSLFLPRRDSATGKILAAYQCLESIGAHLNIVGNALEIAIGPRRLSHRYGRNTVYF